MPVTYIQGAELPDILVTWKDENGNVINFSSGWTFTLRLGQLGQAAVLTKTDLVGAATAPNLTISWTSTEIESLAVNTYTMQIIARHVSSGKDRKMTDSLTITPQVMAP
jgi:hypothetical protein